MGVIFTRGRSTVNAKWSRALKVAVGKEDEGEGRGEKKGRQVCNDIYVASRRLIIISDGFDASSQAT